MDFDLDFDQEKSGLTKKEFGVYVLMVVGCTRKVIAAMLNRSEDTINTHITHIHQKLKVDNTAQAITAGFVRGIVKTKKAFVLCLVVTSTVNSVLPIKAMAAKSADDPVGVPDKRIIRGRQSVRFRPGRSTRSSRRREKVWLDCFGEF